MKQYLGSGRVAANPMSVWSFAAVLTMPGGWAAALIFVQYSHAMLQARRDQSGRPHRLLFSGAAAVLAQLVTSVVINADHATGILHGDVRSSALVLAGVLAFIATNFAVLLTGMWLATGRPSIPSMLPDGDALGYELAMLALGITAAEFLLHTPALIPATLVLVAYVHRSSVVKALQHAARTDPKTGLLNPAAWTEHAANALSRGARTGRPIAVMIIDIDHFKRINDSQGHLIGDQVLIGAAACLRRELRGHDGLGRFGGDEFVVVLEELSLGTAEDVGRRLRAAISAIPVAAGAPVSVSIGLAHAKADSVNDIKVLLEQADAALYRAKVSGRDRLCTAEAWTRLTVRQPAPDPT